jgi:hypothetical protein
MVIISLKYVNTWEIYICLQSKPIQVISNFYAGLEPVSANSGVYLVSGRQVKKWEEMAPSQTTL